MKFILPEHNKYFLSESVNLVETTLLENEQVIQQTLGNLFTLISKPAFQKRLSTDFDLTILDGTPDEPRKEQITKDFNTLRQELYNLIFENKNFENILQPILKNTKEKGQLKNNGYNIGNITTFCKNLSTALESLNTRMSVLEQPETNKSKILDKNAHWFDKFKEALTSSKSSLIKLYEAVGKEPEKPYLNNCGYNILCSVLILSETLSQDHL